MTVYSVHAATFHQLHSIRNSKDHVAVTRDIPALKCTNLAIAPRSHPHSLAYSGLAYQGQTCKLQAAIGQYRTSALASYFQI
jgi:hypothetical protein